MRFAFGTLSAGAVISTAALLGACAADPVMYRLEATNLAFAGLAGGTTATAVRTSSGWSVTRQGFYRGSRPKRVRLTQAEALALDTALSDPALYVSPQPLPGGCIDPDLTTLDITANGATRRLSQECATAPGMSSVLRILFGWPRGGD
ncbi:MAG TPA: hypothetical protein VF686_05195 [Brevundimonas sp.]